MYQTSWMEGQKSEKIGHKEVIHEKKATFAQASKLMASCDICCCNRLLHSDPDSGCPLCSPAPPFGP